ncbi:SDR family oxidoreductase [Rhodococcus erythropolis]|uniref:SDR family oxidoreductase n=1 Tax=Rhodococcus erythropolis TaxID=1833 RepID=UPI001BEC7D55|nr:SDR family NAD(P)-dependent oxidoreductase [Rhodococcus erythropolis]MBT2266089.1 SDR family NAD(P)-dependent oxidoreductase [Rhodococcus erythropolis]
MRETSKEVPLQNFDGKVAFVTGGASGVGLGQAKVLAEEYGAKVVIADILPNRIDEAAAYFRSPDRKDLPVRILQLDITDRSAFANAADEVESAFGPVQLLFNTAGVSARVPAEKATYDDWDWHLQVNLFGAINGVQTFLPRMIELGEGGHIINTGSIQSFFALPTTALYSTSKFAIRGLTEALRVDLAKYDIGVSGIIPGAVHTNSLDTALARPEKFKNTTFSGHDGETALRKILASGMDPVDLARITMQGVLRNDLWIFPYPQFIEQVEERHRLVMNELMKWQDSVETVDTIR